MMSHHGWEKEWTYPANCTLRGGRFSSETYFGLWFLPSHLYICQMTPLGKRGSLVYINSQDSREEVRGFPGESRALFMGSQSWAQYLALRGTQSTSPNQWMGFDHFCCEDLSPALDRGRCLDGRWWLSLCWANLAEAVWLLVSPFQVKSGKHFGSPALYPKRTANTCLPTPCRVPW